ncbi:COX assembly mitochondrial protein homolog isoform X1 [Leptinotarsa decemlineata]|uniref:COX assembly mitochondrial protein homolog isoform X1 n=1 Tax=Leptinotarsa decemlineata TaxID=7539 RepID=UPI003D3055AD
MENTEKKQTVFSRYCNGPHALGDPDDLFMRKVEMNVLIPKKMREKARVEKCFKEVEEFTECCKNTGLLMVVKCRKENSSLKECLVNWLSNDQFKEECTQEYLAERSEYRRTGISRNKTQRMGSM